MKNKLNSIFGEILSEDNKHEEVNLSKVELFRHVQEITKNEIKEKRTAEGLIAGIKDKSCKIIGKDKNGSVYVGWYK